MGTMLMTSERPGPQMWGSGLKSPIGMNTPDDTPAITKSLGSRAALRRLVELRWRSGTPGTSTKCFWLIS